MSEYQYYEFAAIDGPISDEGLQYAKSCSNRANVSRVRWQNTYNFGNFRGDDETMLKYYDAHFYLANWGTVRLGLAFPKEVLARECLQPYLRKDDCQDRTLTLNKIGDRYIIWWERHEDGGWGWMEGDGAINQLIGIREELIRGDFRPLFLGWLAGYDPDEWQNEGDEAVLMPPIPARLHQLSGAQTALIEHFPVDLDALAVAAELSQAHELERMPIAVALERLSLFEMRTLLGRVAEGGGAGVMAELNRLTLPQAQTSVGQMWKCTDFAAKVIEARSFRQKKEAEAAVKEQRRKQELRQQHLTSVMRRAETMWSGLAALMDQKISSAYDEAANQLQELHDAYSQAGDSAEFNRRMGEFRTRYSNRPAMLRRIEKL